MMHAFGNRSSFVRQSGKNKKEQKGIAPARCEGGYNRNRRINLKQATAYLARGWFRGVKQPTCIIVHMQFKNGFAPQFRGQRPNYPKRKGGGDNEKRERLLCQRGSPLAYFRDVGTAILK